MHAWRRGLVRECARGMGARTGDEPGIRIRELAHLAPAVLCHLVVAKVAGPKDVWQQPVVPQRLADCGRPGHAGGGKAEIAEEVEGVFDAHLGLLGVRVDP